MVMDEQRTTAAAEQASETTSSAARAVVLGPDEGTPVWFLGNLMVVKATAESSTIVLVHFVMPAPPMLGYRSVQRD